jgi:hypothetical protein
MNITKITPRKYVSGAAFFCGESFVIAKVLMLPLQSV